jgi:hypothetical protein
MRGQRSSKVPAIFLDCIGWFIAPAQQRNASLDHWGNTSKLCVPQYRQEER